MAYPRLPNEDKHALLRRIVERCAPSNGRSRVIAFDLDGTLMDNRPRTCAILHELGESWRETHPAESQTLLAAAPERLLYLMKDTLAKLGIPDALVPEAEAFWKARFFADDHIRHDVPLPGAVQFARACYEAGAIITYFTGRDLPAMSVGSWKSLRDSGFPIGLPGTELILKPAFDIPDDVFKADFGPRLARLGEVIGVFDNEPGNCNILLGQHPGTESVFVDTQHLPGAPPLDPRVHVVADFDMP